MIFLAYLVVPVLVGVLAQKWKGRTGALWGFLTLTLMVAAYVLTAPGAFDVALKYGRDDAALMFARWLMTGGASLVIMSLLVATLPARGDTKATKDVSEPKSEHLRQIRMKSQR